MVHEIDFEKRFKEAMEKDNRIQKELHIGTL
jgi:hypothetical protein